MGNGKNQSWTACIAARRARRCSSKRAPGIDELQALLAQIITRLMRLLTRQGVLIEEQGMTYLAEPDSDHALMPLQAASCTYRLALGPRAGKKVLSLRSLPGTDQPASVNNQRLCM
jgi:hypothetical protein